MPTPTISEATREAFKTALYNQIAGVDKKVERAREDEYSEREDKSINIKLDGESSQVLGSMVDNNQLNVNVEYYVRPAAGENWETKVDDLARQGHALIMAYANWPAGVARVRKTGATPRSEAGDRTPGLLTVQYAVQYLCSAFQLDKTPNQP